MPSVWITPSSSLLDAAEYLGSLAVFIKKQNRSPSQPSTRPLASLLRCCWGGVLFCHNQHCAIVIVVFEEANAWHMTPEADLIARIKKIIRPHNAKAKASQESRRSADAARLPLRRINGTNAGNFSTPLGSGLAQ